MSLVKIIPKHLWVAASSWGARGISACVQIVSVHYLVSLLGEDKYSAFILLGGLITWCNLSDFGIGNSILNYIAERRAQDKNYEYFILVGSVIVFILFFIVAVFLCFLSMTVAEQYLKIYSDAIINNKIILFYISTLIFCGTALAGIIYKIWYAEQIGWLSNLFPAVCALIGLLNIIVVRKIDGNFSDLLIVFVLFYLPALIIPIYLLLKRYRFEIRKTKLNRRLFAGASLKIIERARPFFIFAVMGAIVLQTDLIVLSQKGDASEIILYGVLLKIFNVIYFIYSAVLQAWWPVCTELRIKKQWVELKKSIRLSVGLGALAITTLIFLVYCLQDVVFKLLGLGGIEKGSFILYCLFCLYFIIRAWCDTYAVLLQTMNSMKPLFIIVPIQALINFILQWYFISILSLTGILIGSIISFLCTVAIYLPYKFNQQIKKQTH